MSNPAQTVIERVGEPTIVSPLANRTGTQLVSDEDRVLVSCRLKEINRSLAANEPLTSFEEAGPREKLFYHPSETNCGIVTCGGLCPGLNNVIRAIVFTADRMYGLNRVLGFRFGYAGLSQNPPAEPMELTPQSVDHIHQQGGTILGSSRGPQDSAEMVDTLQRLKIHILFTIGGDGTLRGARELSKEAKRRGYPLSVVGVPKTIDNDVNFIERSFGFMTAVEEACIAVQAAHYEALGAMNGIGLVKLMGRHSGFIAAHAALASHDVNFCLVPEVPVELEGENGLFNQLERRLALRGHAVIVVAEGAGQDLLKSGGEEKRDASGNIRLKDIGIYLHEQLKDYLESRSLESSIKYIDPSYMIRSCPANAVDSEYCLALGQHAVHAAMSGRTNMAVGFWNGEFTNVPIPLVTAERKEIDPQGKTWQRVLKATAQPREVNE